MHFDLAHAIVSGLLIGTTVVVMRRTGLYVRHRDGGPQWSWPLMGAIVAVIFVLNLIWPSGN